MPKVIREGEVTVIELGPQFDSLDEALVIEISTLLLDQAKGATPPWLVIDLSHTQYFGSNFLELLIRAWKRLRERGGRMALCGPTPMCAEVLHAARLDTLWAVKPTRAEAIAVVLEDR